ncbi:MAG: hypothetical protein K2Y22_10545 [Candidatus Obscuribacterales bacterium]|nr:hypothetical protein [Candidatus Obscuribacterales bacterium]
MENHIETPENGIRGLKHWRHDIVAGLIVALVSVPLSLGIALASGAPPICGLTSEVIAGLVFPFIGGAFVTISGPAAGLAPVLYSSILALGKGDMALGYKLVLPVIMLAGLTQIALMYLKAARFSYLIPRAAVQGMLASIGLLIIGKQIPNFIGHKYHANEFFVVLAETPSHITHLNPAVFVTSIVCLALLFILPKLKYQVLRFVPPHLLVVLVGIVLANFFHLESRYLVQIPTNLLQHGFQFPDFGLLFSDATIIPKVIVAVLALTFVDGTESLATIHAVDQIDPFHRKSNPDRTLLAMGISNICSGFIGGLTIIPGIMKSSTNIFAGGRTAWVNFYNALFLISFLVFGHELIRAIPIAALSAVLMQIGYKLAGPHQWQKMIELGREQLLIFTTTVLVTVCSDLLIGIAAGIAMKVLILVYYSFKASEAAGNQENRLELLGKTVVRLFKNPLEKVESVSGTKYIYFSGPLTCFNSLSIRSALKGLINPGNKVKVVLTSDVGIVDHSTTVYFKQLIEETKRIGCSFSVEGLDTLYSCSDHADSFRYRVQYSP